MPGIDGIGLSAGSRASGPLLRFASDDASFLIEDLQQTLSEGPCQDAAATRRPVMAADLGTGSWRQRWPRFTKAALKAGIRAVAALPLHAGGVRHDGALDLYRRYPGALDGTQRTAASIFAAAAAELLTLDELGLKLTEAFTNGRGRCTPAVAGSSAAAGPPAVPLVCWFDATTLSEVRAQVRAYCASHGLTGDDLYLFVLAVHEAMTNVARHGGGRGQLVLWWHADHLWCEIADHGPGIPSTYLPARQPDTSRLDQRGLWLIRRICTSCKVTTDATGTRLLLGYRLDHRTVTSTMPDL
ncbi:ATP-binding protein [Actinoplanes sp. NPDC051470]|uniref:ATP-binding protein n=1 Tax=Actinoplanes sp. NPDC051470 TaxID=3157224 RepID=UPI00341251F7